MYRFVFRGGIIDDIKEATQNSPSIISRLEEMYYNPLAKAKKTGIPVIGEFYVNAGRYCLLFDVDMDKEKIKIRAVVLDNLLYKIMKGKIPIPEKLIKAEIQE